MNTLYDAADHRQKHVTFRTHRKLHEHSRRWAKAGCPVILKRIKPSHFQQFRDWAKSLPIPLANTTIEATVRDVVSLIRELLPANKVPDSGKPLDQRFRRKSVPVVEVFGESFASAEEASWPHVWNSKTPELLDVSNGDFWRGFLTLGYVTGMRLGDLMSVSWDSIQDDRVAWVAAKTGKNHESPLPEVLRFTLEPLRRIGTDRIFPVPKYSMGRIRREMGRISGGQLAPQSLRRLSVNQWEMASPGCGALIQGCALGGHGVLRHYCDDFQILNNAAPKLYWPDQILAHCGMSRETERRLELNRALKRLPDDRIDDVLRAARAFAG
jgi:integrase